MGQAFSLVGEMPVKISVSRASAVAQEVKPLPLLPEPHRGTSLSAGCPTSDLAPC